MKVVIADDEYYARKAMAKKVLQADPEAEILGDFENGVQVLEYLEEHPDEVDVLLTDVKMPEMDGLHLAQYLFEQESQIEIIIISGYNEFEYARKAISFGVSNYLVKPVQKEELKEALEKIRRGQKKYQAKMQDMMAKRTLQFLSIEEITSHENWRTLFLEPVFSRNDGDTFYIAVIQSMEKENWTENSKAEKMMQRFKKAFQGDWFYFNRFGENVLLLFGERAAIIRELENFVSHARILGLGRVTVGVSLGHTQIEHCTKAYQEAVYAINQRLIEGWQKVFAYTSDFRPENMLDKEKEQMLEDAIEGKRCIQAEEITREIMECCRNAYTLYVTISGIFNLLYRFFCRTDSEGQEGSPGYMLFSYRTDLYRYSTLEEIEDYVVNIVKTMCEERLAVGDGRDYEKYAKNPVIDAGALPEGCSPYDFRDPKIWRKEDGTYCCVIANRSADGSGQILLFTSPNGFAWKYENVLIANQNRYGKMWECPDFFELDGKWVLITSPMDMLPVGFEYHNGNGTLCLIGELDKKGNTFTEQHDQAIDYGIDFYAPQTILTPDGRRIMIGWMQNWDTCSFRTQNIAWFGQMSLPRELSIRNGRLYQAPIKELEQMRSGRVVYQNVTISGTINLEGIRGRRVDMELVIEPEARKETYRKFAIRFAQNDQFYTSLSFHPGDSILKIDRKFSGSRRAIIHQRRSQVTSQEGKLKLRVILDRFSAEVFVNDGEQVLTAIIYTEQAADGISFMADGIVRMSIVKYDLEETTI